MGMSASQARLIQLTARMSDLELEGQQINQQRLNLANQSSAIQEQALKIPVPTAPSTYEFMKDVYTGTDSNGHKVKASSDGKGGLNVSTLKPEEVPTLKSSGVTAEAQDQFEEKDPAAESINPGGRLAEAWYQQEVDHAVTNVTEDVLKSIYENEGKYVGDGANAVVVEATGYEQVWVEDDSEAGGHYEDNEDAPTGYKLTSSCLIIEKTDDNPNGERYTATGEWDSKTTDGGNDLPATYRNGAGGSISYCTKENGDDGVSASEFENAHTTGYSDAAISRLKSLGYVNADGSTLEFDNDGKLTSGDGKFYKKAALEKINGHDAYEFNEIQESDLYQSNKVAIDELITRIKNYEANANDGTIDNNKLAKWRITAEPAGNNGYSFSAYKMNDDGKAEKFADDKLEKGWGTTNIPKDQAGDFDENGLGSVDLPGGGKAYLTKSQELDTDAYKAAEAEYKNKKAEYDHAQEEANTKVKKLQQIDKQLELKLKRLDTERNALNTEIDAVKKVIQDNTDKSFKTFSG